MSTPPTSPDPIWTEKAKPPSHVIPEAPPLPDSSKALYSGGLASEILDLFSEGSFSFWRWIPSKNVLSTHGNLSAESLEDWMMRVHPRDQADFSAFIDQDWQEGKPSSFLDYRFSPNRQSDWVRVRHTASYGRKGDHPALSCLIESFPLTQDGETPLERIADGFKEREDKLLQFVESALDLRIQTDPVPRMKLLQHSIGADLMVLVHFGSKVVATHTHPLLKESASNEDAHLHLSLIEAIASMDYLEQQQPFDLNLPAGSAEVTHYIINPIHWGDGFKGALCAGYFKQEDRIGDHGTTARLSLISAFTDGQLGRPQKVRAREESLARFRKAEPPSAAVEAYPRSISEVQTISPASSPANRQGRISLEDDFLKGTTILLVEDETAVRKLVRKLLEMLGCSVIEAVSGRNALELWPEINNEVDLVVSDVVMPDGVTGWDLAKELNRCHPDLGILLTSGYDELPEDHGLQDLPQIAFLQKPYEVRKLKVTLSRLMQLKLAAV